MDANIHTMVHYLCMNYYTDGGVLRMTGEDINTFMDSIVRVTVKYIYEKFHSKELTYDDAVQFNFKPTHCDKAMTGVIWEIPTFLIPLLDASKIYITFKNGKVILLKDYISYIDLYGNIKTTYIDSFGVEFDDNGMLYYNNYTMENTIPTLDMHRFLKLKRASFNEPNKKRVTPTVKRRMK